jgi:hypothetical protein
LRREADAGERGLDEVALVRDERLGVVGILEDLNGEDSRPSSASTGSAMMTSSPMLA